jgi:uncharacterized protein (DUF1697 family)
MTRHIALLRGINVGGNKRVPMARLRELLDGHGHRDVRTLVQSGNVVLTSALEPEALRAELEAQIADEFGFPVPVVVRSRDELAEVIARNPLRDVADVPKLYQVSFLSGEPDPAAAGEIEAADWGPERVVFDGREIFCWYANGMQRSPLAKRLATAGLGVIATARNWNTVERLLALADDAG